MVPATDLVQIVGLAGALVVALVIFRRFLRSEPDRVIARLILLGLLAKLVGSVARFTVMADLYDGRGDFNRYFNAGVELASVIRSGTMPEQAKETGTPFMDFLVGLVYAVAPNQLWFGFFSFALLSFVGAVLFLQAFRLALPTANHRLYAMLVLFVPTMVFWPSSLGKEAWLVFTLGLAAYGAARALRGERYGFFLAALGGAGAFMVRPHMGALFALCFAGAFVIRFRDETIRTSAAGWTIGVVLVGLGAGYAAANFGDELPQDEEAEGSQTERIFAETDRRTSQGGSSYDSRPVHGLADLGHALVTVPFRPFPTEGHNRQAQLAGLEGVILLALLVATSARLATLPRLLLRRPYVAMAAAYSLGFVIAFSNVGNFGILTRQRAQLLPFLLVLFALPRLRETAPRPPVLAPVTLDEQRRLEAEASKRDAATAGDHQTPEEPSSQGPARPTEDDASVRRSQQGQAWGTAASPDDHDDEVKPA
jgi:hypothetical protein